MGFRYSGACHSRPRARYRDESWFQVAADSLEAILNAVSVIKDMNLQIATAAEEQAAVSEEINRNIVNISDVTTETKTSAEQTMETGQSLSGKADRLRELVNRFQTA